MISQEQIYQYVFREEWQPVISWLHQCRSDIANDTMLSQAAMIFEQEFFKKISDYPDHQQGVVPILENLFVLHSGKFYRLREENYKKLLIELTKRLPEKQAYNYAKAIPSDEFAKSVVIKYEAELQAEIEHRQKQQLPPSWVEIYNRLFELMNTQGPTYFSGPQFFRTIHEFQPYYADYNQFIQARNVQGKSTSRKIYYYDVLMELDDVVRTKTISRLLDHMRPFQREKVKQIEVLMGWEDRHFSTDKVVTASSKPEPENGKKFYHPPKVFISYSWDDEPHKEWVLKLADRLVQDGVEVILDRYELRAGKNLPHFVERSINQADKIVIVFTPNYKLKVDGRIGGVGYEYSIMNADLYKNQTTNEKIIPILRKGNQEASIPQFMHQFIHIDLTNDSEFKDTYNDLLREIFDEPAIRRPIIGTKPTFTS